MIVGPYGPPRDADIAAVRELGFRKVDDHLVPVVHAKLALIGEMRWTDEHPTGHVVDDSFYGPTKLWIGSANFTTASRRSLEMWLWTSDRDLIKAARTFLLELVAYSEPLGTAADHMEPELLPVVYDDEAIAEALSELGVPEDDYDW